MELADINIYRMTHIENIPHILQYGITHKNSLNANSDYITIGDKSLIDTRSAKQIHIEEGETIILGNFIPFYFGIRMPMLFYVMQHGGNFVEKATPAEDIVYLVCAIRKIIDSDKTYFFSDGHATDSLTTFYDKSKVRELPNIIDWDAIKARYWSGNENLILKCKKQAEFLVQEDLPPDYIIGFVCYNEETKEKLMTMGIVNEKIRIRNQAYY
ncbi:type II toxin-antitoxin system toxin DNA ADP-ribosyl transferase DarT [Viscerimonas tarda]